MAGWTCAGCTTTYTVGAARCPQCGSTERSDGRGGSVLPSMTVACGNGNCRYAGQERRVHLRTAAPGVLELPRLVCAGCGFDTPAEAPWPPVNDSENNAMPKNTVHGGPSNRFADETAGAATEPPAAAAPAPDVDEGGEQSSPGKNSSPSAEKPPTDSEPSEPAPQRRARTTASRSKRARTGSSSARSTDGDPTDATSDSEENGS